METSDLLKRVRQIEIKTRGLSSNIFAGEYHTAFKGRGMTFSEVRAYQYGDDIRSIDWNVTARYNHPYVKIFEEERELTVMLLIDVSASRNFGTVSKLKKNQITEIAAVLAFSAIQNNDKIGVIFFSDRIEKFIPPKKRTDAYFAYHPGIGGFLSGTQGNEYLCGVAISDKRYQETVYLFPNFRFHG